MCSSLLWLTLCVLGILLSIDWGGFMPPPLFHRGGGHFIFNVIFHIFQIYPICIGTFTLTRLGRFSAPPLFTGLGVLSSFSFSTLFTYLNFSTSLLYSISFCHLLKFGFGQKFGFGPKFEFGLFLVWCQFSAFCYFCQTLIWIVSA